VTELGVVESNPKQDGRNMVMVIAPHRNAQALQQAAQSAKGREAKAASEQSQEQETAPAPAPAPEQETEQAPTA
jgi:translation initiation factor IF-3